MYLQNTSKFYLQNTNDSFFLLQKKKILLDVFAKFYLYLFKLHIQLRRNSLDNLKKVWHEYFKCLAKPS